MTSTNKISLIDSVNHGYGIDVWLLYTLNDICIVTDSGVYFYFCSLVEASSPLKVLSSIELYGDLIKIMKLYDANGFLLNGY